MDSEHTLQHKRYGKNQRPVLAFISAVVDYRTTVRVLDDRNPILTILTYIVTTV